MSSQIFKSNVPNELFFSFINSIKSNNDDTKLLIMIHIRECVKKIRTFGIYTRKLSYKRMSY